MALPCMGIDLFMWHDLYIHFDFFCITFCQKKVFWIEFTNILFVLKFPMNNIFRLDLHKLLLYNLSLSSGQLQSKELKEQTYFLLKGYQISISFQYPWIFIFFPIGHFYIFFNRFIEVISTIFLYIHHD